jgi:hypothetical protein
MGAELVALDLDHDDPAGRVRAEVKAEAVGTEDGTVGFR